MFAQLLNAAFVLHFDNNIDAFIPEHWAMEGVAILQENMVAASLVHRDFEPLFARHGDVVNTRKPAEFVAKRKGVNDDVTIQNANATNIPVLLDQHVHTSFLIRDGEETKSFKQLTTEYLEPATIAMARYADQLVLAQYINFLENQSGSLGGLTSSNAVQYISNTGLVMDRNKAYVTGRQQIWTPEAQSLLIQNPTFHEADKVGDNGTALRTASIGDKLNFRHWMAQNMSQVRQVNATKTAVVNNVGGYGVGATSIVVDGASDASGNYAGRWCTINGKVYRIVTGTMSTNAGTLVLEYGLVENVDNDDVITIYLGGNVDNASGYSAGYSKYIAIDNGSGAQSAVIQVGQHLTFGTGSTPTRYVVMDVDTTTSATETLILLDKPLAASLADNDAVNYGPENGGYNLAFHRNAITLAIRPLAPPRPGSGAIAGTINWNGASMRVVITYDGNKQGHLVTLDFLAGIKVLDSDLGAVTLT